MNPVPSVDPQAECVEPFDVSRLPRNRADLATLQALSAEAFASPALRPQRVRLDDGDCGSVDRFLPAPGARAPGALLFVHGGRWELNTSRETAFWARACVEAGCGFVGLNFPPLSQAGLPAQIDRVACAIAAVIDAAGALGVDPGRLSLAGHSSGAHLALTALLPRPGRVAPAWATRLRALLLLGGVYDLAPLGPAASRRVARFSESDVAQFSPVCTLEALAARGRHVALPPVRVAVGADETAEYLGQSRRLHRALRAHAEAELHEVAGAAHFDAALEFNRTDSTMRRFVLAPILETAS
jgi:arylformamidase